jgi:hypothetical protein
MSPREVLLRDRLAKARAGFERWYSRLKRAFTAMERERGRAVRLQRQIERLGQPRPAAEGGAA